MRGCAPRMASPDRERGQAVMDRTPRLRRRFRTHGIVAAVAAALLAFAPGPARADTPRPAPPRVLDLAACRRIAQERQPSIAAAGASLAAAEARSAGLDRQFGIPLVTRDLRVRRNQAALGASIA